MYAAENLSLAALELLVHLRPGTLADHYVFFTLELRAAGITDLHPYPPGWNDRRPNPAAQRAGDEWARAARSLALRVPSVLNPVERNYVLNPAHPDWPRARSSITGPFPFRFDARLGEHR